MAIVKAERHETSQGFAREATCDSIFVQNMEGSKGGSLTTYPLMSFRTERRCLAVWPLAKATRPYGVTAKLGSEVRNP